MSAAEVRLSPGFGKIAIATMLGVYAGALVLSVLRTAAYEYQGIQPNMTPMMFILFAPLVGTALAIIAVICEAVLTAFWRRPASFWQAVVIGASYTSFLLFFVNPWLTIICLLLNPVAIRLLWPRVGAMPSS